MSAPIPAVMYCANHPQRETSLRCNRCEKPICPQCAILTPTGYRCRECVRGQQKTFNTAAWYDYPLALFTAGMISYLGSLITSFIGFFTLIAAPFVGIGVAEAVRFVIHRRRAPGLYTAALIGTIIGCLINVIPALLIFIFAFAARNTTAVNLQGILRLAILALYTILVTTSMYYRLTGRNLRL